MATTVTIDKTKVLQDVAMLTSYIGGKVVLEQDDGGKTFERIATTADNDALLTKYYTACSDSVAQVFAKYLSEVSDSGFVFEFPTNINSALLPAMESDLYNFYVMGIVAKWSEVANKSEAEAYQTQAIGMLDSAYAKANSRVRPTRTVNSK